VGFLAESFMKTAHNIGLAKSGADVTIWNFGAFYVP
jgi:hypothetical protein